MASSPCTLANTLLVALGSALGGSARFWMGYHVDTLWAKEFWHIPVGTLAINVLGSFLITAIGMRWTHSWVSPFLLIGVMGGFTTFSSFSKQTVDLLRNGSYGPALGYAALSLILCLFAAWLGVLTAPAQPQKVQAEVQTQSAE